MQEVEDFCVKYLMNEMDPTERFAFEQKLQSDPNLIIEVELMRKTLAKLKKLPLIKTPEVLTKKIESLAAKQSRKRRTILFATTGYMRYAAVIGAIGLSFTVGWAIKSSPSIKSAIQSNLRKATVNSTSDKWVDKKDVIKIDSYNVASSNQVDSLALKNAKKLRLIDKPLINKPYSEDLLLTRTRK